MSNPSMMVAPLEARGIAFGLPGYGRQVHWSAGFAQGLSLIVDEEGEAKTALLRLLAGESLTEAGAVLWQGIAMAQQARDDPALVFWRDPRTEWPEISPVQWAQQQARRYPNWSEEGWQTHAQSLGLQEHLHKEMFRLSTGSKRKVLLAAALASGAPLTLIDEPEAALDHSSIRYLRQALAEEARRRQRVCVVANFEEIPDVAWGRSSGWVHEVCLVGAVLRASVVLHLA